MLLWPSEKADDVDFTLGQSTRTGRRTRFLLSRWRQMEDCRARWDHQYPTHLDPLHPRKWVSRTVLGYLPPTRCKRLDPPPPLHCLCRVFLWASTPRRSGSLERELCGDEDDAERAPPTGSPRHQREKGQSSRPRRQKDPRAVSRSCTPS